MVARSDTAYDFPKPSCGIAHDQRPRTAATSCNPVKVSMRLQKVGGGYV